MPTPVDELVDRVTAKPLRLLFYDTENTEIEIHGRVWSLKVDGYLPHHMVKTPKHLICWSAKWSDGSDILSDRLTGKEAKAHDDSRIVDKLSQLMKQADYVVAHNGDSFDWKNINTRLLAHGLQPFGDMQAIDTLKLSRSSFNLESHTLDYLARFLGYDGKLHTTKGLWGRCFDGDVTALKEMQEYNRFDSVILENVFNAIVPYVKKLPRLVDATEWRDDGLCPYCGQRDLKNEHRDYRTNVNNFRRYRCNNCQRTHTGWQAIGAKKLGSIVR